MHTDWEAAPGATHSEFRRAGTSRACLRSSTNIEPKKDSRPLFFPPLFFPRPRGVAERMKPQINTDAHRLVSPPRSAASRVVSTRWTPELTVHRSAICMPHPPARHGPARDRLVTRRGSPPRVSRVDRRAPAPAPENVLVPLSSGFLPTEHQFVESLFVLARTGATVEQRKCAMQRSLPRQ